MVPLIQRRRKLMSLRASSLRSSGATGTTNNTSAATHLASSYTAPPRIEDLERRLSTDRVLDIFTMLPKVRSFAPRL